MVVLTELCILIVVKIQANNLNSTSFAHSDPIMIPHFSKLDDAQNSRLLEQEPKPYPKLEPTQAFPRCSRTKLEHCKKKTHANYST